VWGHTLEDSKHLAVGGMRKIQFANLYVVHPHCVYAIDGGVGPSNTTELSNVLYWICVVTDPIKYIT
jgi:hypothetical protein